MDKQHKRLSFSTFLALLFSTVGQADNAVTGLVLFGDFGTSDAAQLKTAKALDAFCANSQCDAVVGLGDNFYPKGVKTVQDKQFKTGFEIPFQELNIPFFMSLGNHDYMGNVAAQLEYAKQSTKWKMPSTYYDVKFGNAHLIAIDTNKINPTQLAWLDETLSGSDARWKIVFGHHPILSNGRYGDNEKLKTSVLPLLKKHEVEFYANGHEHDKQILAPAGMPTTFLVSGAFSYTRKVDRDARTVFASETEGFVHLLLHKDHYVVQAINQKAVPEFSAERPHPAN